MTIKKNSPQGNAFYIMGVVYKLLKEVNRGDEWPAIQKRMMGGDYDNLCRVAKEVTFGSIEIL